MNMKKMMLTAVFALALMGMVFSMPVPFAQDGLEETNSETLGSNPPAENVILYTSEGGQTLNATYPYLVNDESSVSGTLNGTTCTAYFEAGTLTLWNYDGGDILHYAFGLDRRDLTIELKGNNTVDGRIFLEGGGDLTITAETAASLTVTHTLPGGGNAYAIQTSTAGSVDDGAITIGGKAVVTVNVTNEDEDYRTAYGIFAKQSVTIEDDTSVYVTAVTNAPDGQGAFGIYSEKKNITIETTGDVFVDCSGTANTGVALATINDDVILKRVGLMELYYPSGAGSAHYRDIVGYNEDDFVIEGGQSGTGFYTFQYTTMKFVSDGLNVPDGVGGTPITMINAASGVSGGVSPFTFEMVIGPLWLEVSADGKITGTRPVTYREATWAEIRVTDDEGAYREITIDVGAVSGPKPVGSVRVNDTMYLSESYPYLVNGTYSRDGEVGGAVWTAHFDHISGTLTLRNYDGGPIRTDSLFGESSELTIVLIGTNTITSADESASQWGINNNHYGSDVNIMITSETGGSLDIA